MLRKMRVERLDSPSVDTTGIRHGTCGLRAAAGGTLGGFGWKGRTAMRPNVTTDRRRGRRVQARLQIELQMDPGGPAHPSDTIDISSNGVYFNSPRWIAPLTKLGL